MKKYIYIIRTILLMLCLAACGLHSDSDNPTLDIHENAAYDGKLDNTTKAMSDDNSFIFTWITYNELRVATETRNEKDYKKYIEKYFVNMKKIGVTDCFVQVRPFADSMYPSEVFPLSIYAANAENFDPFAAVIDVAGKYGVGVHAWINPYRISSNPEFETDKDFEEYEESIMRLSSGVYFNPASLEAQKLILSGVEEILT